MDNSWMTTNAFRKNSFIFQFVTWVMDWHTWLMDVIMHDYSYLPSLRNLKRFSKKWTSCKILAIQYISCKILPGNATLVRYLQESTMHTIIWKSLTRKRFPARIILDFARLMHYLTRFCKDLVKLARILQQMYFSSTRVSSNFIHEISVIMNGFPWTAMRGNLGQIVNLCPTLQYFRDVQKNRTLLSSVYSWVLFLT